jgi:hypothetical protein
MRRAIIVLEEIENDESDLDMNILAMATANDICDHFGGLNVMCVAEIPPET